MFLGKFWITQRRSTWHGPEAYMHMLPPWNETLAVIDLILVPTTHPKKDGTPKSVGFGKSIYFPYTQAKVIFRLPRAPFRPFRIPEIHLGPLSFYREGTLEWISPIWVNFKRLSVYHHQPKINREKSAWKKNSRFTWWFSHWNSYLSVGFFSPTRWFCQAAAKVGRGHAETTRGHLRQVDMTGKSQAFFGTRSTHIY